MALIEYRGKTGVNYLTPSAIKDVITVPKGLFLGLDGQVFSRSVLDLSRRSARRRVVGVGAA